MALADSRSTAMESLGIPGKFLRIPRNPWFRCTKNFWGKHLDHQNQHLRIEKPTFNIFLWGLDLLGLDNSTCRLSSKLSSLRSFAGESVRFADVGSVSERKVLPEIPSTQLHPEQMWIVFHPLGPWSSDDLPGKDVFEEVRLRVALEVLRIFCFGTQQP